MGHEQEQREWFFPKVRERAVRLVQEHRLYPADVSDEEWAFAAPYLTLMDE